MTRTTLSGICLIAAIAGLITALLVNGYARLIVGFFALVVLLVGIVITADIHAARKTE